MSTKVVIEIRHLQQAGLDDDTIAHVLAIKEQAELTKAAEANRRRVAQHREKNKS